MVFASGWLPEELRSTKVSTYEERITLWRASDAQEAILKAELEAADYAGAIDDEPDKVLAFAQSFSLSSPPGDGVEVFSLLRDSPLSETEYVERFFATGAERIAAHLDPE